MHVLKKRLRIEDDSEFQRYWNEILKIRISPNGIFSYKIFQTNFVAACHRWPHAISCFQPNFIIRLRRRDNVGQIVSYARAMTSGKWFADAKAKELELPSEEMLSKAANYIAEQDVFWDRFLRTFEATALNIYYEDLLADRSETLNRIANFVGVTWNGQDNIHIPSLTIQRDEDSKSLRFRYLNTLVRHENIIFSSPNAAVNEIA
jgi:LPS sulfotransferase NodH